MKILLTENVPGLGLIGDVKEVKAGYARNYLLPNKKASLAQENNVRLFEHQKRMIAAKKMKDLKTAKTLAQKIESMSCTIQRKISEDDKIFGSVSAVDIEKALHSEGMTIDKKMIDLPDVIKTLGVYSVPIKIQAEVIAKLKVWVVEE